MDQQVAIRQVAQILAETYPIMPWSEQQIANDMVQETTDYYYVHEGEVVVGFMSVTHLVGESEVTNIAVRPAYQGKGYARQLLAYLDESLVPVFLEVRASNQRAIQLYRTAGFTVVGRRANYYHAPVEDALIMKKEGL